MARSSGAAAITVMDDRHEQEQEQPQPPLPPPQPAQAQAACDEAYQEQQQRQYSHDAQAYEQQQQYQQQHYQQQHYDQHQQYQQQYYGGYDASHAHYHQYSHDPYASAHAASAYPPHSYPPSAYMPAHSYPSAPPPTYPPTHDSSVAASSALAAFFDPRDPPPAAVPPPASEEERGRVEKAAEYAAKNGPQFEALMRDKQRDNPEYAFLQPGHAAAAYYRFRLWCALTGAGGGDAVASAADGKGGEEGVKGGAEEGKDDAAGERGGEKQAAEGGEGAPQGQAGAEASGPPLPSGPPPPPSGAPQEADGALQAAVAAAGLPMDVGGELVALLVGLNGTKEAIKGGKAWVAWRAGMGWAGHIAWVLRERMAGLKGQPDRQLHVIYLVNDVLFNSLQQRVAGGGLDVVAGALQPCLGFMLAALFHGGGEAQSSNQDRLGKILAFWAAKEVYPGEVMTQLDSLMRLPPDQHPPLPPPAPLPPPPPPAAPAIDYSGSVPYPPPPMPYAHGPPLPASAPPPPTWPYHPPHPHHYMAPVPPDATPTATPHLPTAPPPFPPPPATTAPPPHLPSLSPAPPSDPPQPPPVSDAPPAPPTPAPAEKPPYPLFPPGLIPGMVRKRQIGSGVPYAPMAPHDIPSSIPPPHESDEYLRRRIRRFFKAIGEKDPMAEGDEDEEGDADEEQGDVDGGRGILGAGTGKRGHGGHGGHGGGGGGRRSSGAKPRALSPPPAIGMGAAGLGGIGLGGGGLGMEVDPETGMLPDGSVVQKAGMGNVRLGLGAAVEAEAPSQYDDVYSSFRRMLSSSYHTSISERAARKYER